MALPVTAAGRPACEVTDDAHDDTEPAVMLVPIRNGGRTLRWVSVCGTHGRTRNRYGSQPNDSDAPYPIRF